MTRKVLRDDPRPIPTPANDFSFVLPMAGDDAAAASPAIESAARAGDGEVAKGSWVIAARLVSQVSQLLIVLVAARVMSPAAFGGFALLSALAVGLTRLSEAGWREYIMTAGDAESCAQTNTMALACGLGSLTLGLLFSVVMLWLEAGFAPAGVMALMAVWVLLATLSATQAGILVRRGQLRFLAWSQIAGEVVGFLAAVAVFAAGGGIFGLAAAKLALQATIFLASIGTTRWFPVARPRGAKGRQAFVFSRRILATRLISFASENVAVFVIGALISPAGAGLFRAAGRLAGALNEVVSEPVRLLAWTRLRSSASGRAAEPLLVLAILVSTPLFVGLAVTADSTVSLLLGRSWSESATLLVAFALAGWMNSCNAATEPLLAARGRVDLLPRLSLGFTAVSLSFLIASAPFGLLWIAIGQLVAAGLILPVIIWVQHRYGGLSPRRVAAGAYPALVGAALLAAAVWTFKEWVSADLPPVAALASEVAIGGLVYIGTVYAMVPRKVWKLREAE